jgi:hypothetical protein
VPPPKFQAFNYSTLAIKTSITPILMIVGIYSLMVLMLAFLNTYKGRGVREFGKKLRKKMVWSLLVTITLSSY